MKLVSSSPHIKHSKWFQAVFIIFILLFYYFYLHLQAIISFSQQHCQFALRMNYLFLCTHQKVFFLEIYHLLQYLFSALLMSTLKITFNTSKTGSTTAVFQMSVLWSSVQNQELCTLESGELDTNDTGQSKKISHKPKQESLSTIQY